MRRERARAEPANRRAATVSKRSSRRRRGRDRRNERHMAARKDDGQEPPASGRPGVIWRLPATRSAPQGADTPDAPAAEAEADRPTGRRVPLLAAIGLAVALVCVGLYAAWSEFGSDIFGTGGEQTVASAPPRRHPSLNEPVTVRRAGARRRLPLPTVPVLHSPLRRWRTRTPRPARQRRRHHPSPPRRTTRPLHWRPPRPSWRHRQPIHHRHRPRLQPTTHR